MKYEPNLIWGFLPTRIVTGEEAFPFGRSSRATTCKINIIIVTDREVEIRKLVLIFSHCKHIILILCSSYLLSEREHFTISACCCNQTNLNNGVSGPPSSGCQLGTSAVMGPKCQVSGIVRVRQLTMLAFVTTEKDTWKASLVPDGKHFTRISGSTPAKVCSHEFLSKICHPNATWHFLHQKDDGQVKRSTRANSNDPRSFSIDSSMAPEECGVHINYPSLSHFLRWAGITAGSGKKQRAPLPGGPSVHHTAACITQRAGPHPPPAAATRFLYKHILLASPHDLHGSLGPLFSARESHAGPAALTLGGSTTLPACPPPLIYLATNCCHRTNNFLRDL